MVVGDVNSTMACTLAAAKLTIPVAHVEAGLRSFDRAMPEEINRVVTDAVADLLLTNEPSGDENLAREGVDASRVRFVGNVMIDSLVEELPRARALAMPARVGFEPGRYALVTLHRPSNVDDPARLEALVGFLESASERAPAVFPVHPRTRDRLERYGLLARVRDNSRIKLMDPVGYREAVGLMADARYVLTDSGGIQEETSYLGVPCLTLRHNTERPVTATHGTNTVVGDDLERARGLVEDIVEGRYKKGGAIDGWDGHAAERITRALVEVWG